MGEISLNGLTGLNVTTGQSGTGCGKDCTIVNGKVGGQASTDLSIGGVTTTITPKFELVFPGSSKVAKDPNGLPLYHVVPNPDGDKVIPSGGIGLSFSIEKGGFKGEHEPGGSPTYGYEHEGSDFSARLGHGTLRLESTVGVPGSANPLAIASSGGFEPNAGFVVGGTFRNAPLWKLWEPLKHLSLSLDGAFGTDQDENGSVTGAKAWYARATLGADLTKWIWTKVAVEGEMMRAEAAADPSVNEYYGAGTSENYPTIRTRAEFPVLWNLALHYGNDPLRTEYKTDAGETIIQNRTISYYGATLNLDKLLYEGVTLGFVYATRHQNIRVEDVVATEPWAESRLATLQLSFPLVAGIEKVFDTKLPHGLKDHLYVLEDGKKNYAKGLTLKVLLSKSWSSASGYENIDPSEAGQMDTMVPQFPVEDYFFFVALAANLGEGGILEVPW
ncbi:MAG: hypothetical protein HY539_06510 [Deltaproteobacteria bacterium]|nr:hypothetical protein [Deltaproteobacteria bacterium]MBI4197461.1 hypothetical protein [Deltaproteobacteria bacterium]